MVKIANITDRWTVNGETKIANKTEKEKMFDIYEMRGLPHT